MLPAGFQVQPSEFAKVALVVGMAMLLGEGRDGETGRATATSCSCSCWRPCRWR